MLGYIFLGQAIGTTTTTTTTTTMFLKLGAKLRRLPLSLHGIASSSSSLLCLIHDRLSLSLLFF